jgi:ABC-type bacteriocin/lantibiotic exporter with double-glycine peptidase domain
MYIVSGMKLIRQTKQMACWYASAQMLIQWRRATKQVTEANVLDPSEDDASKQLFATDHGITNEQIVQLAKNLGLVPVPAQSPSEEAIESWLMRYGPLWVNGKTHIVVIAGIQEGSVLVYDPSPSAVGVDWRPLAGWFAGSAVDSADPAGTAVFLHCPV